MAATFISSLNLITKQMAIYYAIPAFVLGVIGGILNIIVFLSLKTFRQSSCVFYLIFMSVFDLGRLISNVWPYVMRWGFEIDWGVSSLFFCKIRYAMFYSCTLISMTCLCLATIDQYFATCTRPRWQQWCNIKLAHRLTIIFIIIWCLHAIPFIIFYNHVTSSVTNRTTCQITNDYFRKYETYGYFLILINIFPLITVVFGFMAYYNARTLAHRTIPLVRRELDKQLTVMVLMQVLINICMFLPFSIICIFTIINMYQTDPVFIIQMSLATVISSNLFLLSFASPFYTYVCVSKRFRRQLKYVFFQMHLKQCQPNEIVPNELTP